MCMMWKPPCNKKSYVVMAWVALVLFIHAGADAFAGVLDLTDGAVEIAHNPAYSTWPLTVECRIKLDRNDQYNIIIANETKSSPRHWELFTTPGNGNFCV